MLFLRGVDLRRSTCGAILSRFGCWFLLRGRACRVFHFWWGIARVSDPKEDLMAVDRAFASVSLGRVYDQAYIANLAFGR